MVQLRLFCRAQAPVGADSSEPVFHCMIVNINTLVGSTRRRRRLMPSSAQRAHDQKQTPFAPPTAVRWTSLDPGSWVLGLDFP